MALKVNGGISHSAYEKELVQKPSITHGCSAREAGLDLGELQKADGSYCSLSGKHSACGPHGVLTSGSSSMYTHCQGGLLRDIFRILAKHRFVYKYPPSLPPLPLSSFSFIHLSILLCLQ